MSVAAQPFYEKTDEQQAIVEMVRQFVDEQIIPNAEHYDARGRVPGADRRADEGARALRGDDPRGLRRDGARPDDLRDDRRGALARLDLDLRRDQHALHRLLPADEVRHRRAARAPAAEDGDRRAAGRVQPVRARAGLRRAGDQDVGARSVGDDYEINGQKMWVTNGLLSGVVFVLVKTDREADPAAPRHDLLHLREGARQPGEPGPDRAAQDQEDGLQGRRVDRAGLRRLPRPAPT